MEGSHRPPSTTTTSHKRVGSVVRGKYRVEAFLATGTMANVYAATHRNGSRVALKILHAQLANDPSLCERFKREGYFANSIGHPGIVRAIDDDVTEDGCAFLVMELLEGETLEERRRRKGGKLPVSWVLPVADALLDILAAAHAREVVHRDLKPDNVFVTKDGDVKVLDFGVARFNDGKASSDMTGVGMVLGTPAYMPPEQALGKREAVDAQSDIWAVGATLFVVLSGEPVHAGGDAKAKLIATARTAARPLHEAAPTIPRAVAAVIDRALAFHKQDRWPDADAMREAIRWARMSLEGDPAYEGPTGSVPIIEAVPPAASTRRNVEDEPTLARAAPRDVDLPQSTGFLTSAPPITQRELPALSAVESSAGPVFSLRRERDTLESPSTERMPTAEVEERTLAALATTAELPRVSTLADDMPPIGSYDPSAAGAMGIEPSPNSDPTLGGRKSIDVNVSFTRPMIAIPAPRPAAGAPPAPSSATPPQGSSSVLPAAQPSGPPKDPPSAPAQGHGVGLQTSGPLPGHAATPPLGSTAPMPMGSFPAAASTGRSTPASTAVATPEAVQSPRRSLPPETPGPLLAQIVKPRRFLRVILPLALALCAGLAVFVTLRTRAANARAVASTRLVAIGSTSSASSGSSTSARAEASPASTPATSGALPAPTGDASGMAVAAPGASTTPAPGASAEAKRTKPRQKPRPRPAATAAGKSPDENPAAAPPSPAAASGSESPVPVDLTPKDSLPSKEPSPVPQPIPQPVPSPGDNP